MKTSKLFSIFAIAFAVLGTSSMVNGNELPAIAFTNIQVNNNVNLKFVDGNEPSIMANDAEVSFEYEENTLIISAKNAEAPTTVTICAPQLHSLEYNGDADITVSGNLRASQLVMSVTGNGTMVIEDANVKRLSCSVQGSGNIFFYALNADMMVCNLANTGKLILGSVTSDDCLTRETAINVVSRNFDSPDNNSFQKASFVAKDVKFTIF